MAKWIYDEERSNNHVERMYLCSECEDYYAWGDYELEAFKYCPNCGAKMDGQDDDE